MTIFKQGRFWTLPQESAKAEQINLIGIFGKLLLYSLPMIVQIFFVIKWIIWATSVKKQRSGFNKINRCYLKTEEHGKMPKIETVKVCIVAWWPISTKQRCDQVYRGQPQKASLPKILFEIWVMMHRFLWEFLTQWLPSSLVSISVDQFERKRPWNLYMLFYLFVHSWLCFFILYRPTSELTNNWQNSKKEGVWNLSVHS